MNGSPCLACALGKWSDTVGASAESTCVNCLEGTYNDQTASTSIAACLDCGSGRYSIAGQAATSSSVCVACLEGTYNDQTGAYTCIGCPIGRYSSAISAISASNCTSCGSGYTTATIATTTFDDCLQEIVICQEGEFVSEGACKACNDLGSYALIAISITSFGLGALFVQKMSADRQQLLLMKVFSTFCQCCQLTTLIEIKWPRFALFTIPFSFPFSDSRCVASGIGWTQLTTFYAMIYAPITLFTILIFKIKRFKRGNPMRMQLEEIFGFLVILWYSPLLQSVGKMFACYDDIDRGWVLAADPDVSCEEGMPRTVLVAHAIVICAVVGLGLPLTILFQTRRLRDKGLLRADSPLASVFEYYTPTVPYFESVHLLRKGLLILLVSVLAGDPILQSVGNLSINAAFLLALEWKRPMVQYSSSIFKGSNLFHLVERASATATVIGNALALSGALDGDDEVETVVGAIFTAVNLTFVVTLFVSFNKDVRLSKYRAIAPLTSDVGDDGGGGVDNQTSGVGGGSRTASISAAVTNEVESLEKEFKVAMSMFENSKDDKEKEKIRKELPFLLTKFEKAIRKRLLSVTGGEGYLKIERMCVELDKILGDVQRGFELAGVSTSHRTCVELMEGDEIVSVLLTFVLKFGGGLGEGVAIIEGADDEGAVRKAVMRLVNPTSSDEGGDGRDDEGDDEGDDGEKNPTKRKKSLLPLVDPEGEHAEMIEELPKKEVAVDLSELSCSGLLLEVSEEVLRRVERHIDAFSAACRGGCSEVAIRILDAHDGAYEDGEYGGGKQVTRAEAERLVGFRRQDKELTKLLSVCWARDDREGKVSAFSAAISQERFTFAAAILDRTEDGWATGNLGDDGSVRFEEARKLVLHFSAPSTKLPKKERKEMVKKCLTLKQACAK